MINDLTNTAALLPPPTAIAMTAPKTRMKNAQLTCIQNRENTELFDTNNLLSCDL